jgi:hypothetical protein|tara:strand:+ start:3185 stop:3367 length:183 start_codon:yes stop_codon:yes gene_type:complete
MPFLTDFSPEMIDFLIKMEKNKQKTLDERPFLQIPAPEMTILPENEQKTEENSEIIVLDI